MSMFFYIKRDAKRDPWKCEMSWRDNVFTLTPRTPDRAPSLTSFLQAMRGKSYNAPKLIKEDLLCFFKFNRKGVELAGDLGIVVSGPTLYTRACVLPELTLFLLYPLQTNAWGRSRCCSS
ncbi:hypothetical protein F511_44168 [Dorcoceras hygrometricum]|uniref:Uncharacterized protein n=1 Tax=Dorcoceras hygrometricum TaxID=472368 RepID=A0A2Z7B3R3_9LAMI|nr:hypothetical protein F511_44168 [Dorcoceras hygrometricum]